MRDKRTFAHLQYVIRQGLQILSDAVTVHRLAADRIENKQIEGPGKKIRFRICSSHRLTMGG